MDRRLAFSGMLSEVVLQTQEQEQEQSQVTALRRRRLARRPGWTRSRLLNDLLFDVPDQLPAGTHLTVTPQLVEERLRDMVKNRDLSQYIL